MAIALPVECDRYLDERLVEGRAAIGRGCGPSSGSILIIGDDRLLIRALDRLLKQRGFDVATEDRWRDHQAREEPSGARESVALTIVDLPDHHVLDETLPIRRAGDPGPGVRFLWIGTTPPATAFPCFLAKPFTTDEFLSRVETLLATNDDQR